LFIVVCLSIFFLILGNEIQKTGSDMRKVLLLTVLFSSSGLNYATENGSDRVPAVEMVDVEVSATMPGPLNSQPVHRSLLEKCAKIGRRLVPYFSAGIALGISLDMQVDSYHKVPINTAFKYEPSLPKDTFSCRYYYETSCHFGDRDPENMKQCEEYIKDDGRYINQECMQEEVDPQYYWAMPAYGGALIGATVLGLKDMIEILEDSPDPQRRQQLKKFFRLANGVASIGFSTAAVGGIGTVAESMPNDPLLASAWAIASSSLTGLLAVTGNGLYDYEINY
jgi:hypothetical protein